ncbi:hypothetical protein KB236_06495 [Levilactobacillus brevis]|uniref:Uncharacterized protein n=1 Tax=Levilactobacillus hammesii TaxID=267633 RepID=A0A921F2E9_9LACO|nr:hypothetical protein KB236_06495 [Levilactobacillus brevis]HJE87374.1 hypothetical protein [Levilactobacillus hammesii]
MPHKIQKFALLIVLTITTILVVSAPAKAQAAKWHHITFQGKTYRSKYTIKQMRKKYHLKYRKTYHGHGVLRYSTTFNAFEGILHNAHTGHWESGRWQSGRKIKGYYAQFVSQPTGDGSIVDYSSLINLKTGHLYKSHNN